MSFLDFNVPRLMSELTRNVRIDTSAVDPTHKIVLVCGIPRSGTTLVTQLIAKYFDVGYIDHLTARFWQLPGAGALLRRSVFGDRREISFRSDYGRTEDPLDVHAMGWFWKHALRVDKHGHRRNDSGRWWAYDSPLLHGVCNRLDELLAAWQKPVVMLGQHPMRYLDELESGGAQIVVVQVVRDLGETAASLYLAKQRYGRWGIEPTVQATAWRPDARPNLFEHTVDQVVQLEGELGDVLARARKTPVVTFDYESIVTGGEYGALKMIEQHFLPERLNMRLGARVLGISNKPFQSDRKALVERFAAAIKERGL